MSTTPTGYQTVQGSGYSRSLNRENEYDEQWSKIKVATVFVVCNGMILATMGLAKSLGQKDVANWTGLIGVVGNFVAGFTYLGCACQRVSQFVQNSENTIVS